MATLTGPVGDPGSGALDRHDRMALLANADLRSLRAGHSAHHHAGQPHRLADSRADADRDPHAEADRGAVCVEDAVSAVQRDDGGHLRQLESDAHTNTATNDDATGNDCALLSGERGAVLLADGGG